MQPLVFALQLAFWISARLHKNKRSFSDEPRTIVICKYMGMGSIIHSIPLRNSLKEKFLLSKIIYVTSEKNKALLQILSPEDSVLTVDDSSVVKTIISTWKLLMRLRKLAIDVYIDLETHSYYSTFITACSGANQRVGFQKGKTKTLSSVYTDFLKFDTQVPVTETYLSAALALGCDRPAAEFSQVHIPQEASISLRAKLQEAGIAFENASLVIVNPNASDLRIERRWDADNYVQLLKHLSAKHPSHFFILTGSADEVAYVEKIYRAVKADMGNILNLAGELSLPELFEVIRISSLVITNDSGPLHMAIALRKKTIALFGPCSPEQYGANANGINIYKKIHCSPCVHSSIIPPCHGNNICMKSIGVEEVAVAFDLLLQKNAAFQQSKENIIYSFS
jgi:ADP-heptose:LPS heptosyltransferase